MTNLTDTTVKGNLIIKVGIITQQEINKIFNPSSSSTYLIDKIKSFYNL